MDEESGTVRVAVAALIAFSRVARRAMLIFRDGRIWGGPETWTGGARRGKRAECGCISFAGSGRM